MRSLVPKLDSLSELHSELECDISIITETWAKDNDKINEVFNDHEDKTGYVFIRKDRVGDQRGGGVAISYKKDLITMTRARLPRSNFEIVAAVGRRTGQRRKVVVLALYIPPWFSAERNRKILRYINDCVILLCNRYDNLYLIVGGDYNGRSHIDSVKDSPMLKPVVTPPTRGSRTLDIILTNAQSDIVDQE